MSTFAQYFKFFQHNPHVRYVDRKSSNIVFLEEAFKISDKPNLSFNKKFVIGLNKGIDKFT